MFDFDGITDAIEREFFPGVEFNLTIETPTLASAFVFEDDSSNYVFIQLKREKDGWGVKRPT